MLKKMKMTVMMRKVTLDSHLGTRKSQKKRPYLHIGRKHLELKVPDKECQFTKILKTSKRKYSLVALIGTGPRRLKKQKKLQG